MVQKYTTQASNFFIALLFWTFSQFPAMLMSAWSVFPRILRYAAQFGAVIICFIVVYSAFESHPVVIFSDPLTFKLQSASMSSKGLQTNQVCIYDPKHNLSRVTPPGPLTVLASFPGSGNTWVRHLIQISTGKMTGASWADRGLQVKGFPGEIFKDGTVVVVKDHPNPEGNMTLRTKRKIDKVVVIIRDPLMATIAEFNRMHTEDNHTGLAPVDLFLKDNGKYWLEFARPLLNRWKNTHESILQNYNNASQLCVLIYEELVENLIETLEPCINFLGYNLTDMGRTCLNNEGEGNFHRKARSATEIKMILKTFNDKELEEISYTWKYFKSRLKEAGYKNHAV